MLLRTPFGKTAIASLLQAKPFTAVSCSFLAVNNFVIFAKNIRERFPACVPKIFIVIIAVPWRCPLGNCDWRVRLLIQWKWPVHQRTGLTKNTGHPGRRFLSCLSPRLLATLGLSRFPRLKTAKLRRLVMALNDRLDDLLGNQTFERFIRYLSHIALIGRIAAIWYTPFLKSLDRGIPGLKFWP